MAEWTATISSNVDGLRYHPDDLVLEVRFKGGRVYHYTGVTPEVWEGREDAESIGRWVATVIKPGFPFEQGEYVAPEPEEHMDPDEPEEMEA